MGKSGAAAGILHAHLVLGGPQRTIVGPMLVGLVVLSELWDGPGYGFHDDEPLDWRSTLFALFNSSNPCI